MKCSICESHHIGMWGYSGLNVIFHCLACGHKFADSSKERWRNDNPETVRSRFEEYNRKTAPVRDHYIKKGIYKGIKGVGKIEDINGLIVKIILH